MPSLFQVEVESFLTTPPTSPANASRWLVKPTGVSEFAGHDNDIATFNSTFGWSAFERAKRGWIVFVKDVGKFYTFDGSSWMVGLSLLSDDAPLEVGTAAAGTMPLASRADHVHAHGAQTNAADHQVASNAAAGFMSGPDKTKLGTIASAADVSPVRSVHARTGAIVAVAGDYSMAEIAGSISMLQHGAQTDGGLHGVATASKAGFMSGPDKAKLNLVVPNAGVPIEILTVRGPNPTIQSSVAGSERITASNPITFSARQYEFFLSLSYFSSSVGRQTFYLNVNSTADVEIARFWQGTANVHATVNGRLRLTPGAGSQTIHLMWTSMAGGTRAIDINDALFLTAVEL